MKDQDVIVTEYVKRLTDETLRFLNTRFSQDLPGDKAVIAETLSRDREIDKWLSSAVSGEEWFDMVDEIGEELKKEYATRLGKNRSKRKAEVSV